MKGYIKDFRKELNSDIWLMPPLYHRVWQYLKYMVNHKANKIPMKDGSFLNINPGQHLTSVRNIAEEVGWYERGVFKKPNPKTISSILDWLEKQEMIQIERGEGNRQYTLVTLINWESYQVKEDESNSKETEDKQSADINNNDKNDNNDKKKDTLRSKYKFETHHMKLAELLFKKIQENNPNAKEPNYESWANTFRLMMERDKKAGKEIQNLIIFSQQHHFWYKNILSADKLRKQYDRLLLEMNDDRGLKVIKGGASHGETSYQTDYSKYDFSKRRNLRGLPEEN